MSVGAHADVLGDFYCYDPGANSWTAITVDGAAPSARDHVALAAAPDGTLYLFGGGTTYGQSPELARVPYLQHARHHVRSVPRRTRGRSSELKCFLVVEGPIVIFEFHISNTPAEAPRTVCPSPPPHL